MIRAELVASGRDEVLVDGERPVHDAITYLTNNAARMNYAGAIAKGLPIGSGNVEATCKTLVGLRMKRCGSRWHNDTGNHILHLRALAISDRWDEAMANLFAGSGSDTEHGVEFLAAGCASVVGAAQDVVNM